MSHTSPTCVAQVVRPAEGGIRRHLSLLASGLDRAGFSSTVYAPAGFSLDVPVTDVPQVTVEIAPQTRIAQDLRTIGKLTSLLTGNSDLVHAHGLRAAIVGVLAAVRAGLPAIFTAHNLPPSLNPIQRFALLYVARRSGAVVAVSRAVEAGLIAAGIEKHKIEVVPNGIPVEAYASATAIDRKEIGLDDAGQIITYVGRLSAEKGVDTLLDAYQILEARHSETHLLVIGTGLEEARLRQKAASIKSVRFLGSRTDVAAIMNASSLVVVPSYTEGQGIVAIEAMACGLPVVASNVGGLRETVIDGETGLLVSTGDAGALADAIHSVLEDPRRAAEIGAAGRRRAFAEYSVDRMIDSIALIYTSVLAASR